MSEFSTLVNEANADPYCVILEATLFHKEEAESLLLFGMYFPERKYCVHMMH